MLSYEIVSTGWGHHLVFRVNEKGTFMLSPILLRPPWWLSGRTVDIDVQPACCFGRQDTILENLSIDDDLG